MRSRIVLLIIQVVLLGSMLTVYATPKRYDVYTTVASEVSKDGHKGLIVDDNIILKHYLDYKLKDSQAIYDDIASMQSIDANYLLKLNDLRVKENKKPLKVSKDLVTVAKTRAIEASKKWSHTRPNGKDCFSAFDEVDNKYKQFYCGENLAYVGAEYGDNKAIETAFQALCDSKTHYDNMLFDEYTYVGIYTYKLDDVYYTAFEFSSTK